MAHGLQCAALLLVVLAVGCQAAPCLRSGAGCTDVAGRRRALLQDGVGNSNGCVDSGVIPK
jgi:hypothetical protein